MNQKLEPSQKTPEKTLAGISVGKKIPWLGINYEVKEVPQTKGGTYKLVGENGEVWEPNDETLISTLETIREFSPEKPEESENKIARTWLFDWKNNKPPKGSSEEEIEEYETELEAREEAYKASKKKIVGEFLANGKEEEANDFLLTEVTLKIKNDLDNGHAGLTERAVTGVNKGLEKWDNWGSKGWEGGWRGVAKGENWTNLVARSAKTFTSLAMTGIISGNIMQGLNSYVSTSALGGGLTSYLGKRLMMGGGMAVTMSLASEKKRKWVSRILTAGSIGVAAVGAATIAGAGLAVSGIVISSAVGLGLARLLKSYNKGKEGEELTKILKTARIDTNSIDTGITNIEKNIEENLKKTEKAKIIRRALEGAMAVAGSVASLEIMGTGMDYQQTEVQSGELIKSSNAQMQVNDEMMGKMEDETTIRQQREVRAQQKAEQNMAEMKTLSRATVRQGEGIENAFIKQIENNPKLAQSLPGYKEGVDLREFARGEAHRIALEKEYVDSSGQVKITEADKLAFILKTGEDGKAVMGDDGKVVVEEKALDVDEGKQPEALKLYTFNEEETTEEPSTQPDAGEEEQVASKPEGESSAPDSNAAAGALKANLMEPSSSVEVLRAKLMAQMPPANNIGLEKHSGEQPHNLNEINTPQTEQIEFLPGISEKDQLLLQDNLKFIGKNPFHLSDEELVEALKAHQQNMDFLVAHDTVGRNWGDILVHQKAKDLLAADVVKDGENIGPVIAYAHKLQTESGLKPEEGFLRMGKAETFAHFEARALQQIMKRDGNLDRITLHDETPTAIPQSPDFQHTQQINSLEETPNFQNVYQGSINNVFPEHTALSWFNHGSILAKDAINLENPGQLSNLSNYLKQLQTVTGLNPNTGEDAFHYVHRALAEAEKQNKLEEARFK